MVEIDLAQVRIPHELIGIPVPEASYILSARSHRFYSSVRGSVCLSLSYITHSAQPTTEQNSSNDDGDWEQLSGSSLASRQGPSSLPEGRDRNGFFLSNFIVVILKLHFNIPLFFIKSKNVKACNNAKETCCRLGRKARCKWSNILRQSYIENNSVDATYKVNFCFYFFDDHCILITVRSEPL